MQGLRVAGLIVVGGALMAACGGGEAAPAVSIEESALVGAWSSLTNPLSPVRNLSNPILLTDGTVIAHVSCTSEWYRFTPSNTGSYINGTWSAIAQTTSGYAPRFFGSGVLPDGRAVIEGGEYNGAGCGGGRTSQGAVYDPTANAWTPITPPAGWGPISDAAGIVLPSGSYMQTDCCDNPEHAALLNPSTLTWTATGSGKFDVYDEESMALMHDGTVLTVDAYVLTGTCGTGSERYTPATGAWTSAGSTVVQQSDCNGNSSFEVGPLVARPDGTAVSFSGRTSGTPQTAIYTMATGTWAGGPAHPSVGGVPYTMADGPAAVLPNGNVLVAMSPTWTGGSFPAPTHYWELNANNTFSQAPDKSDAAGFNSYQVNFVLLPTGQVMAFTIDGPAVEIYTPSGAPLSAWRPTVSSVPSALAAGQTYALSGTQLNGLNEGSYYGDDTNSSTNFPLVRITNTGTGHVFYARTFNHSSRSIAPGAASSFNFTVPAGIENGAGTLEVVANGIPSAGVSVTVGTSGAPADMVSPTPGSVLTSSAVTFSWTTGSGVSQYWLYVGSSAGAADLYSASQGTATSGTVSGLPTDGRTLFVRLWSSIGGTWQFHDYTYTAVTVPTPAQLVSPAPGSTLSSATVTFSWTTGVGVSQYWLYVGSSAGALDIYSASQGTATSGTVSGLPTDGRTLFVRLWSLIGGTWQFLDYTYTAASPAQLSSPTPGSTLFGAAATFFWTTGSGVSQYWLYVGSSAGALDIYSASQGTATSGTVSGLPIDGRTLFVRLWSLIGGTWQFLDYTYTAATQAGLAQLVSPAPGSRLSGSTATFSWTAGSGASLYYVYIGSSVGASDLYAASQGLATAVTIGGLPLDGRTLYVRMWTLLGSSWQFLDYTYGASIGGSIHASSSLRPGTAVLAPASGRPLMMLPPATP